MKALAAERREVANSLVRDVERLKAKLAGIGVPQEDIDDALGVDTNTIANKTLRRAKRERKRLEKERRKRQKDKGALVAQ